VSSSGFDTVWKRNIPRDGGTHPTAILVLGVLSLVFFLLARALPLREIDTREMHQASQMMAEALDVLRQCRLDKGLLFIDTAEDDPNQTGLIGLEFAPITTSRGNLEAKRTTTNPNFAALLVHLLREADVREGDSIAIGASGSFPALIVATLSAAKAMNVRALPIYSVGASQWGANERLFTWLHMERCLRDAGWLDTHAVAISLGGEGDIGKDWSPELKSAIESMATERGARFLYESDLKANVALRMKLYKNRAEDSPIRAFVNIGGAWANMGESTDILKLRPGLVETGRLPPIHQRGMIYEMVNRGVPVIHLLYIKGLAERFGLPWDPVPLPAPGQGGIYRLARSRSPVFLILAATYLCLMFFALIFRERSS
jgi:poly-gamma-glutamate system protein